MYISEKFLSEISREALFAIGQLAAFVGIPAWQASSQQKAADQKEQEAINTLVTKGYTPEDARLKIMTGDPNITPTKSKPISWGNVGRNVGKTALYATPLIMGGLALKNYLAKKKEAEEKAQIDLEKQKVEAQSQQENMEEEDI